MTRSQRAERARRRTRTPTTDAPLMPHLVSMTWRDGLFAHYPIDPEELRPSVPEPLELDTWGGKAWIGVLPFVLAKAGLRGSPSIARRTFPELNVRTYVRFEGDPGLFFFSIDVDSPTVAATVGRLTRLPVHRAKMHVSGDGDRVAFSSSRVARDGSSARFSATYEPDGEVFHPEPDSFPYWTTARRRLYAPEEAGGVLTAEISHAPWPLQPATATISENTLFAANDLPEPIGEPVTHFCGELAMTGSIFRRLRG